jgi:hypothetical protein
MAMNRLQAGAMLAAGAVAGGVLAATLSASAADSGSSGSTPASTYGAAPQAGGPGAGAPGARTSTPARTDESTPSDSIVATLTKKAEAAVPGGTVYRVETDAGDGAYEAHMSKSGGTLVTVKFDKDLKATAVEDGMGKGDPMPSGAGAPPASSGLTG